MARADLPAVFDTKKSDPNRPFKWTRARMKAAALVAQGDHTEAQIAAQLGIQHRRLQFWKSHPDFKAEVERIIADERAGIIAEGIAVKEERVQQGKTHHSRLLQLISERAADPTTAKAPGAKTGMLARTLKILGSGENAEVVEEYTFDAALSKELREWQKYVAQELGQWTEKQDVTSQGERINAIVGFSPEEWLKAAGNESSR